MTWEEPDPSIIRRAFQIRRLMRHGNDTVRIAEHLGTGESSIWNVLARAERMEPGILARRFA